MARFIPQPMTGMSIISDLDKYLKGRGTKADIIKMSAHEKRISRDESTRKFTQHRQCKPTKEIDDEEIKKEIRVYVIWTHFLSMLIYAYECVH